ncbi:MAG: TonB family protein [Bacteroidetes bacterium]|nr:TonB family protein [Bacteroidota bacterium]
MKKILFGFLFLTVLFVQAQVKSTSSFTIGGEVLSPVTVSLADLKKWKEVNVGDLVITNHLGEKKSEAKGLKGILLKEILQTAEIKSESPKVLSEYYFVFTATDGYKVVYSWNELFNTSVGESVFLITEKNGKPVTEMDDAMLVVSTKDFKTGRRNVKGLTSIAVMRAKSPLIKENSDNDSSKVFTFVQVSAAPVGGFGNFDNWVRKNLKYPPSMKGKDIEGNVFVKFIVETNGSITNVEIVRGINSDFDREAIRLMSSAPKWKPGKMNGKAVRQSYTLPIMFEHQ